MSLYAFAFCYEERSMRRYIVSALLSLFVLQSSGAAFANSPGGANVRVSAPSIASILHPLSSAIEGSQVFAELTGSGDRYALMHMPMPHLTRRLLKTAAQVPDISMSRLVKPVVVHGMPEHFVFPKHPPRERTYDPLATRSASSSGASFAPRVVPGRPRTGVPVTTPRAGAVPALPQGMPRSGAGVISANAIARQTKRAPSSPSPQGLAATDAGAGLNPYWTYETRAIPGVGTARVNVATGNLVAQTTDVDIPERDVNLAFTRTYNSQSQHDSNGDDGSEPSIFGNLWTNTYDAHIVFRYSGQTVNAISVYDVDGTRCDYTPRTNGTWKPCAGQYATLEVDTSDPCKYWWIRKDGSSLLFHTDAEGGGCTPPQANLGRLYAIYGRNSNNNITFNYSFSGQNKTSQNITQIVVNHSDGQSLTLNFAQFSGINELSTITYPKPNSPGQTVEIRYNYDSAGDLLEVDKPGNDATPNLSAFNVPAGDLPQTYGYTQPLQFLHVCGPRATISLWQNQPNPATDGACIHFDFDSSVRLTDWITNGISNPQVGGGYLQPSGPKGWVQVNAAYFVYGTGNNTPCGNTASSTTTMCDSDGHSAIYTTDSSNRVTQTQSATGDTGSGPTALVSTETWDANNDLIALQSPQEYSNGTTTNISYDGNGNVTKMQLPKISTSLGSIRPTLTATYDAWSNLTSLCDAVYNAGNTGACPTTPGSGSNVYVYDTTNPDSAEPYGKLTDTYSAINYHTKFVYNYNSQNEPGDYGLPTKIAGDEFTELDNVTTPTPQINFAYDQYGNVTSYGLGLGASTMVYNDDNWRMSTTDPDNVTSHVCYNEDGSVSTTQTALQFKMDGNSLCGSNSTSYIHDTDGDVVSVTKHFGNAAGTTTNTYDGLDRLVQVDQPQGEKSRYVFDLTQNDGGAADLSISGWSSSFNGYGNLYKVQRYFTVPGGSNSTWNDVTGNAYDAMDRPVQRFQRTPGSWTSYPGPMEDWLTAFDASGQYGLPASGTDPTGDVTTYGFDGAARLISKSFSDGTTPNLTYENDPDGRIYKATSSVFGDETYTYDAIGDELTYAEGGGPSALHPTISYTYYPNGWRSSLTINAGSLFNSSKPEFTYDYQMDGMRKTLTVAGKTNPFSWTYTTAGRMTAQSDPWTGNNFTVNGKQYAFQSESAGYDLGGNNPTGTLTSLTFPIGAVYQSLTHDAENEVTAFNVVPPSGFSTTQNPSTYVTSAKIGYDDQGRFTSLCGTSPATNGCQQLIGISYQYGRSTGPTTDPYTGAAVQTEIASGNCTQNSYSGIPYLNYDAAGRDVGTTTNYCGVGALTSDQRTYDAQDYTTADTTCAALQNGCQASQGAYTNAYGWAAQGELRTYSTGYTSNTSSYRFHWDGSNLLFVTDGNGNLVQLNVEKLAVDVFNPNNNSESGFVVYDRDFSGTCVDNHGKAGDSGLNVTPNYSKINYIKLPPTAYLTGSFPAEGTPPVGVTFDMTRTDGYQVGALSLQGARAYDPSLEQWTTPDVFKGSAADPTSQWAYAWNNGNPITSADPSGFDTLYIGFANAIPWSPVPAYHVYAVLQTSSGSTVLSFGPGGFLALFLNNNYNTAHYLNESKTSGALYKLAACSKGPCSWEATLLALYKSWANNSLLYNSSDFNSNFALSTILYNAGLPTVLPPGSKWPTPGWRTCVNGQCRYFFAPFYSWNGDDFNDIFASQVELSIFGVDYIQWATGDACDLYQCHPGEMEE